VVAWSQLAFVAVTTAMPPLEGGFAIGGRAAVALPYGYYHARDPRAVTDQRSFTSNQSVMLPVWLDIGGQWDHRIFVGGFASVGPILPSGTATEVELDLRLGIEGHYRFFPNKRWSPWAGLGVGIWEFRGALSGPEFASAQGGLDLATSASRRIWFGPFVAFTVAQFGTSAFERTPTGTRPETAFHGWAFAGLRLIFE
jgi:hypothetical protein